MKDPSRAHTPRPNRSINTILTTTNVESISTAVRLRKITRSAKPRVYCCYLETSVGRGVLLPLPSSFVHLTHAYTSHPPLCIFFPCALYNLSHLYYPLYHFKDVFLCLFITKALFFKCFKHDFRNTKL